MTTILELRDVKYFFDGDNYYKKINNHTLQKKNFIQNQNIIRKQSINY